MTVFSQVFSHLCQLIFSWIMLVSVQPRCPGRAVFIYALLGLLMGIRGSPSILSSHDATAAPTDVVSCVGRVQVSLAAPKPLWNRGIKLFYLSTSDRNSCVLEQLLSQSTAVKQAKVTNVVIGEHVRTEHQKSWYRECSYWNEGFRNQSTNLDYLEKPWRNLIFRKWSILGLEILSDKRILLEHKNA